jgi:hypothetical protein
MQFKDLDQLVGKYVDITYDNGDGGSGWVVKIDPPYESKTEKTVGRMVHFDYGMGFFVTDIANVRAVDPPPGDEGIFNPDNSPLPFP